MTLLSLFLITGFFSFAQGITLVDSVVSNGIYRKFRLYVPPSYDPAQAAPLVIDLHGYTSNGQQEQLYSNFMPIADTAGFLVLYPDGSSSFGGLFWNSGITASPDDVQYISQLIDFCEATHNIDYMRVYSCGMSNGAIMSYYLACELAGRITAIASVTGTMFNYWFNDCDPARAVPVMEIHGSADGTVPYTGDVNFAPVDSVIGQWVSRNNCNPVPLTTPVPDVNASDNSVAVNYLYSGGNNGSTVELYKVFNGSHSWPGAVPIFANTNQDFKASVEIWRFFRQYRLSQFISNVGLVQNQAPPAIRLYPNPSSGTLLMEGLNGATYSIISLDGRLLAGELYSPTLDISGFEKGIYFLSIKSKGLINTYKFVKN